MESQDYPHCGTESPDLALALTMSRLGATGTVDCDAMGVGQARGGLQSRVTFTR